MGHAIAHLGWRPAEFWRATLHEYQSAMEAKAEVAADADD
jgi:hypothetical protein